MLPRLTKELRNEIKAAIVAKVITDGNTVLKEIEELPGWIESQAGQLNIWCEGAQTANGDIYCEITYKVSEKFWEVINMLNGLSAEQYFKEKTEQILSELHSELLEVEKEYRQDIENPAPGWISATYPYLAKFIYGYRHLAWQIYCVSIDFH